MTTNMLSILKLRKCVQFKTPARFVIMKNNLSEKKTRICILKILMTAHTFPFHLKFQIYC